VAVRAPAFLLSNVPVAVAPTVSLPTKPLSVPIVIAAAAVLS
jgi:hypothetical protein